MFLVKTKLYTMSHTKMSECPSIYGAWSENAVYYNGNQGLNRVWCRSCKAVLGEVKSCLMKLFGGIFVYPRAHFDDGSNAEHHENNECNDR